MSVCSRLKWLRTGWCCFMNKVKNLRFHKKRGFSWPAELLLRSQEGLCFVKYVQKNISDKLSFILLLFMQYFSSIIRNFILNTSWDVYLKMFLRKQTSVHAATRMFITLKLNYFLLGRVNMLKIMRLEPTCVGEESKGIYRQHWEARTVSYLTGCIMPVFTSHEKTTVNAEAMS